MNNTNPPNDDPLSDEEIADLGCPPGIMSVDEDDPESVAAFVAELNRRIEEIESGRVKKIPSEEVFRKLREKYQEPD
jgi:hypothetical protein